MAKLKAGDPVTKLSASEWNRHVDVADWYFRSVANGQAQQSPAAQISTGRILIKNSSSADRRIGEILKVGDYIPTSHTFADKQKYPWFDTAIHDGTDAPFAVLLEPITDGSFGWAQIAGVCPALVNFGHADQRYARPAASNDVLQGDVLGQVRVLYKPSGTGEKECMVDLNGGRYEGFGKPDSNIAKGSTGTVSFYNGLGGSEGDSGMNCTGSAKYNAVTSTKVGVLALMNNVLYIAPWEP